MTDLYPDEEGYISDGLVIGFCKAAGSIVLHESVYVPATGVTSYVSVDGADTDYTGIGIALRAADTNDYIPVVLYGIVKQTVATTTFPAGYIVCTATGNSGLVTKMPALSTTTMLDWRFMGSATQYYRLGLALQPGTTAADDCLIAVGRFC